MISAPGTVEYNIPNGPKKKVSTNATPTDFGGARLTIVVLPGDAYPAGAVCVDQEAPSHQRCTGTPDGSGYQPGGTDGTQDGDC